MSSRTPGPHQVTKDFEAAIAEYTGAPFAVAVNSCTAALLLACRWFARTPMADQPFVLPKRTYVGVPMSVMHAGGRLKFQDYDWQGAYRLKPYPIWDSARWLTSGLYGTLQRSPGRYGADQIFSSFCFVCISLHASKTLGVEQGGVILHDNPEADEWFRRMRFDGRTEGVAPKEDTFTELGYHCYMNPSTAAQALLRLHSLPRHNAPLPNDNYPDLSQFEVFK